MTEPVQEQVARQVEGVQRSAQALQRSAGAQEDSADRRTELAADRTVLAAERTYAAWVRTGLAALASGVGAKALLADLLPAWFGDLAGSGLLLFAGFCFAAGVWRELCPSSLSPRPDVARLPRALLLALNGFLIAITLATLAALWLSRR